MPDLRVFFEWRDVADAGLGQGEEFDGIGGKQRECAYFGVGFWIEEELRRLIYSSFWRSLICLISSTKLYSKWKQKYIVLRSWVQSDHWGALKKRLCYRWPWIFWVQQGVWGAKGRWSDYGLRLSNRGTNIEDDEEFHALNALDTNEAIVSWIKGNLRMYKT